MSSRFATLINAATILSMALAQMLFASPPVPASSIRINEAPQHSADLVQGPLPDGTFFMPQYLSELIDAAKREKLNVETVFAIHALPTPWAKITEAVASASANSK